jgi:hypothetical protein
MLTSLEFSNRLNIDGNSPSIPSLGKRLPSFSVYSLIFTFRFASLNIPMHESIIVQVTSTDSSIGGRFDYPPPESSRCSLSLRRLRASSTKSGEPSCRGYRMCSVLERVGRRMERARQSIGWLFGDCQFIGSKAKLWS